MSGVVTVISALLSPSATTGETALILVEQALSLKSCAVAPTSRLETVNSGVVSVYGLLTEPVSARVGLATVESIVTVSEV